MDRRAPFASAQFQKAIETTDKSTENHLSVRGPFSAGWAKVEIRSPIDVPLAGYAERKGAASTGVADPCYVRAFAISNQNEKVLLLTADLLAVDHRVAEAVQLNLRDKLKAERILFSASHTHSGPGAFVPGWYELAYGNYQQDSFDAVVNALTEAGRQAIEALRPASIGHARASRKGLITNRVENAGSTDNFAHLLFFQQLESKRSAALWSFAAHPITQTHTNLKRSADYPGIVAKAFENHALEQLGFVAGGVGSMNPKFEGKERDQLTRPLITLVQDLIKQAKTNRRSEGRLSFAAAKIDFPPIRYRISQDIMLWPWIARALIPTPALRIQALQLNGSTILTLPGEISGQLTEALRSHSRSNLAVWSFNGGYVGYILPRPIYSLKAEQQDKLFHYETKDMSFLGPWGADYLLNIGMRLVYAVQAQP